MSEATIIALERKHDGSDVFWGYEIKGHKVFIKNPRYEPDSDGEHIFYSMTNDGAFQSDLKTEVAEDIWEEYADAIREALEEDYKE